MHAIDLLVSQHREIEKLLSRLDETTTRRHKEMLLAALAEDLTTHLAIEEHQFYPVVRVVGRPSETRAIERSLADLAALDVDDEPFMARLDVLREVIAHHVRAQETDLFPKTKRVLDPEEMHILGASLEAEQRRMAERRRACHGGQEALANATDPA